MVEHEFSDKIYIEREDEHDYIVICPESSDCGQIKVKDLLKVIAQKNPELYMSFVSVEMLKEYT